MSPRRYILLALLPALFVVGGHVILQYLGGWQVLEGRLIGPDAYMRLLRVRELWDGGGWYDAVSARGNAPFGEILHWTRPLDVLLLLGGALGALSMDFETALFAWAAVIGPLLHLVTLLVLLWACRPLFDQVFDPASDQASLVRLGLLFAVQFFISFQFAAGRPDHHGLNTMLFIAQMGFAFRLSRAGCEAKTALWAALAAALALWISIEGGLGAAMILTTLTAAWVLHGGPYLRRIMRFLGFLCLALVAALVLERPPHDLLAPEFDRLSIVHLALFAILALFSLLFAGLSRFGPGPASRLGLTLAGAAGTAMIMGLWLPGILDGPMAKMAPLVREVWFANNAEVSPVLRFDDLRRTGPNALAHLGLVIVALPTLLQLLRRSRGEARLNWAVLAVFLCLTLALALREARWVGYAQILSLPPCIALLHYLFGRFGGGGLGRAALPIGMVIFLATGPLIGGGLLRHALPIGKTGKPCELPEMARFLAENYPNRPHTLLNFIYSGPELLYRTQHKVIATPYHRNTAGIVDTIRFLGAIDEGGPKNLVKKRDIDLVLICPGDPEADNYRRPEGAATLLMRLEAGRPPPWLKPIALPVALNAKFKLFQVTPGVTTGAK